MDRYLNRKEAGEILAKQLGAYANRDDVVVLALPRGGVPVAFEIAKELKAPLDVFIVRKIGVPGHSELAMGAIAIGDATVFNDDIIRDLQITEKAIQEVIEDEKKEMARRSLVYRGDKPFPDLKNKIVILVDDGIATGATIRAAIKALKQFQPAYIVVAVPVADRSICHQIKKIVDELHCPLQPLQLYAVGGWYDDFSQTEDEEVFLLLNQAAAWQKGKTT